MDPSLEHLPINGSLISYDLPGAIVAAGPGVIYRYIEFFTVHIRNPNTRRAYGRSLSQFFHWCEQRGLNQLEQINSLAVAAYIEQHPGSVSTRQQQLSAIRQFFAWLVLGQQCQDNPAKEVKAPKQRVKVGKTPVLSDDEIRRLFGAIDVSHVVGLRDKALIAVMFYSFARIGAVLKMRVEDYFPKGKRYWLRLHEKGGRYHEVPAHHRVEEFLDLYLEVAGISKALKTPLFRSSIGRSHRLTEQAMGQDGAWRMLQRRAKDAGIKTAICNHSFRASGITNYLRNGGSRDNAQKIAAHGCVRTTALYDRRGDDISLDEIERIHL
jgi:site-specific recombinase XerD